MTSGKSTRPGACGRASRFWLGALATWRLTHLLSAEDGPAGVIARLRARAGDGSLGEAMDCFFCLSLWVSLPVAVAVARDQRELVLTWLALSGAACLLERANDERAPAANEIGAEHELLWPAAEAVPG